LCQAVVYADPAVLGPEWTGYVNYVDIFVEYPGNDVYYESSLMVPIGIEPNPEMITY